MRDVSRETEERFEVFAHLLSVWTRKINLIAPSTVTEITDRHIEDSRQIYPLAPSGWRRWADLGSGGGLPGLVIAILATEDRNQREVILVESDARKCAFLRTVLRETETRATIINERIENTDALKADVVSARALGSLTDLLGYADQHMSTDGCALFPKGQKADQEVDEALERWTFACEKHASRTDKNGVILKIGDLKRA